MKRGFTACLLPILLLSAAACAPGARRAAAPLPPMEYAQLCEAPDRCLILSRLVLGTDHLGKMDSARTIEVLDEAVKLGINTFDTAPIYAETIEARLGASMVSA
jgi:hypothetical protein